MNLYDLRHRELVHSLHDSGVDVTKLLEAEEPRAVGRVIEGVALSGSG